MTNVEHIKRELIDIFNLHGIYHYTLSVSADEIVSISYEYNRPNYDIGTRLLKVIGFISDVDNKMYYSVYYNDIFVTSTIRRASVRHLIDQLIKHPEHYEKNGEPFYDDIYMPNWI